MTRRTLTAAGLTAGRRRRAGPIGARYAERPGWCCHSRTPDGLCVVQRPAVSVSAVSVRRGPRSSGTMPVNPWLPMKPDWKVPASFSGEPQALWLSAYGVSHSHVIDAVATTEPLARLAHKTQRLNQ